jgi:hypothetical protein
MRPAAERPSRQVLVIAGLFADKHDLRRRRAFARNHLRGVAIERAARARGFRLAQGG